MFRSWFLMVPLLLSSSADVHRLLRIMKGLDVERFGLITCKDEFDGASNIESEE